MPLRVQVVTPEREVEVCDDATFVLAHGVAGDMGLLPGIAPLLIALGVGELRIDRGARSDRMLIDGGFLQAKDDSVIVLAEYAVRVDEIDAAAVVAEVDELRRRLQSDVDNQDLKRALARAEAKRGMTQVG